MKKVVIFSKSGRLRFIGHLDLMRSLQRAMNRADIPLKFSQGFNPHPLMAFAGPLPLGLSAEEDILEFVPETDISNETIKSRLNSTFPEGLTVKAVYDADGKKGEYMHLLSRADYTVTFPSETLIRDDGSSISTIGALRDFFALDELIIEKVCKKNGHKTRAEFNIRPYIYNYDIKAENGEVTVELLVSCGCENNVKMDAVMHSFYAFAECLNKEFTENIVRGRLYFETEEGFVTLEGLFK